MHLISIEDLVYEISSRFDASITPAEVRSLIGSKDSGSFELDDLFEVLSEAGIDHESIESLSAINFDRFVGVGLFLSDTHQYIFSRDSIQEVVVFQSFHDKKNKILWNDFLESSQIDSNSKIFRLIFLLLVLPCFLWLFITKLSLLKQCRL